MRYRDYNVRKAQFRKTSVDQINTKNTTKVSIMNYLITLICLPVTMGRKEKIIYRKIEIYYVYSLCDEMNEDEEQADLQEGNY